MFRSSAAYGLVLAVFDSVLTVSAHGGHNGLYQTTLNIVNKAIAPDGYSRQSVLANGTHPGPLISGYKVRRPIYSVASPRNNLVPQGDTFHINVNNELYDNSMNTSTTLVRTICYFISRIRSLTQLAMIALAWH